jgi:hypothetical protein
MAEYEGDGDPEGYEQHNQDDPVIFLAKSITTFSRHDDGPQTIPVPSTHRRQATDR